MGTSGLDPMRASLGVPNSRRLAARRCKCPDDRLTTSRDSLSFFNIDGASSRAHLPLRSRIPGTSCEVRSPGGPGRPVPRIQPCRGRQIPKRNAGATPTVITHLMDTWTRKCDEPGKFGKPESLASLGPPPWRRKMVLATSTPLGMTVPLRQKDGPDSFSPWPLQLRLGNPSLVLYFLGTLSLDPGARKTPLPPFVVCAIVCLLSQLCARVTNETNLFLLSRISDTLRFTPFIPRFSLSPMHGLDFGYTFLIYPQLGS